MTREERKIRFIKLSKEKHNNYYTYDKVEYINNKIKVCIICPIHGEFYQEPSSHLKGYKCKKCSDDNRRLNSNINEIVDKLNKIHNNKYSYPNLCFNNNSDKIKIICPIHGEFQQRLSDHLNKHQCPACGKTKKKTITEFIIEANKVHNNLYDYSKFIYKNDKEKGIIICRVHGEFEQSPNSHLRNHGCPKCVKRKSNTNDFITKANKIHNNYYDYSESIYYGSDKKITIICPIHGEFEQLAAGHLQGFGCSKCNKSKGEIEIERILQENKIEYETQKYFDGCKLKNKLYFDFYLPKQNLCIEYDGEYHYKDIFGGLDKQRERDTVKDVYCYGNNIRLLRIPYTSFSSITEIISQFKRKEILYNSDPSGKYSKENYLKKNCSGLYDDIIKYSDINKLNIQFKEKVYCYKYNILPPKCKTCGHSVKYKNSTEGYYDYCSYKCIGLNDEIIKKKQNTTLTNHGVKYPILSQQIKNKTENTLLEKYNVSNIFQCEMIQQKIKETNINKYGVDNPMKLKEFQDKRLSNFNRQKWRINYEYTMLMEYGVTVPLKDCNILSKLKETNLDRYGVDNPMKQEDIKDKSRKNNMLRELIKNDNINYIDFDNEVYNMSCDCGDEHVFNIPFKLYNSRKKSKLKYCTVCFPIGGNSQLEKQLLDFILCNYSGEVILNTRKIISPYELDIYLPGLKIAFEFNGLYWHSGKYKDKKYHQMKSDMCLEKDIQLIHIWEDDWKYRQEIIKSMILDSFDSLCVVDEYDIKDVDQKLANVFIGENSLEKINECDRYIGLYQDNNLITLMCIGDSIFFINKNNTSIKNIKNLIDYYNDDVIININCDNNTRIYEKIGFELVNKTEPKYYYIKGDKKSDIGVTKIYNSGFCNLIYKV